MSDSTFAITFDELAAEVGSFLGYLRGAAYNDPEWTAQQLADIKSCVKAGLHNFYFPTPLPGEKKSHSWSFLTPVRDLTLASGARTVVLPGDFGGFEGPIYNLTSGAVPVEIPLRDKSFVDGQYALAPSNTGRPLWVSERPQSGPADRREQRRELYLFPQADAAYTLRVNYYLIPELLDGTHQHCYGGPAHAQTVIESCLAVAEQRKDDRLTTHTAAFAQRLAASVSLDRRHKPQHLGPMTDRSDGWAGRSGPPWLGSTVVTVNGVVYE